LNKKAQGEQFNWIFVIVSGAIILGFFTMFTFQYITLQEKRQHVESLRFFGNVLGIAEKLNIGGSGSSVNSYDTQGLRFGYNVPLEYYCDETDARIIIGGKNKDFIPSYNLKDEVVFINEKMIVNGLDLGLMPWKFPFQITNFIYLSDPKKQYYAVYDQSSKEYVDNLEEKYSVIFNLFNDGSINRYEKTEINKLKPKENSKIIIFSNRKPSENKIKELIGENKNVNLIYVDYNNKKINYFEDDNFGEDIDYYSDEIMLGAFFTDNQENYQCSINRAKKKLSTVAVHYSERTKLLKRVDTKTTCQYDLIDNSLVSLAKGNYEVVENLRQQNNQGAGCLWVF